MTEGDAATQQEQQEQQELLEVVRAVVERHTGETPDRVSPQGGGLSSHAFDVGTPNARLVVRIGQDEGKLAGFERERRCAERARSVGVPTQDVVGLGLEGPWAYTISHHLNGEPATDHPRRMEVIEGLGRLAALVHTIPTVGYGRHFTWVDDAHPAVAGTATSARLPASGWAGFLYEELDADARLSLLLERGLLLDRHAVVLRTTLEDVSCWDAAPVLNHGDLRLKNVVVNEAGEILGLIDWEVAVSSIGSAWDISLALHDLGIDAKQAFLAGYGLSEAEVRHAVPAWRLFNTLNYAPQLEALERAGDAAAVDRLRTRLTGALDLYGDG